MTMTMSDVRQQSAMEVARHIRRFLEMAEVSTTGDEDGWEPLVADFLKDLREMSGLPPESVDGMCWEGMENPGWILRVESGEEALSAARFLFLLDIYSVAVLHHAKEKSS